MRLSLSKKNPLWFTLPLVVGCLSGAAVASPDALTDKKLGGYHASLAGLPFSHDYPTKDTSQILQKELAFQRATQVYLWALPAVNMVAMKEGHEALMDGEGYYKLGVYEDRLKPNTIITTPNSDVIYGLGWINMKEHGPMVLEAPERLQALMDDMWHKALVGPINKKIGKPYMGDIGLPGPDAGKGGLYLILPPGEAREDYDAKKYFIYESDTYDVFLFLRSFFEDSGNLKPAVDNMERIKVYPLKGKAKKMHFYPLSDVKGNSVAAHDWTYFAMLDRLVQKEADNKIDPYMNGMLESLGIKKGVKFMPSEAEKTILTHAAATGWKMAKDIAANFDERKSANLPADSIFWKGKHWVAHTYVDEKDLFQTFMDTNFNDIQTGHTLVDAKAHMYINHYSISNGMFVSAVGAGAKYTGAYKDSDGEYLNGSCSYSLTLPANVPAKLFWSVTAYDASTAAGLATNNKYPSIGDRDNPEQNKDGSITLYFGPKALNKQTKNYLHTPEGKGWFGLIRLYGPKKSFFDRTWQPSDFKKISCK